MKKIMLPLFLLIIMGCKKRNQEPPVNQKYEVHFLATQNKTTVTGRFSNAQSGQDFAFSDNSSVAANGVIGTRQIMCEEQYCYPYYSWDINGLSDITFTIKKKTNTLVNTISRADMGDLNIVIDSVLSINNTMRMSWTGTPCQPGDDLTVTMRRNYDGKGATHITSVEYIRTPQIVFDYKDTKLFEPGTYTLELSKIRTVALQQADAGASGNVEVWLTAQTQVVVK